jgi:hypothetical protein
VNPMRTPPSLPSTVGSAVGPGVGADATMTDDEKCLNLCAVPRQPP